jgi:hypothetical protein
MLNRSLLPKGINEVAGFDPLDSRNRFPQQ